MDQQLDRALADRSWTKVVLLAGLLPAAVGYGLGSLLFGAIAQLGFFEPVFALETRTGLDVVHLLGLVPLALRAVDD